jgi:hypothetical protein
LKRSQVVIVKWICAFIAGALFASTAIAQPSKVFAVPFHPTTIKVYIDDMDNMLNVMKTVTTPQQAAAFSEKFRQDLPRLEGNIKRYIASHEHAGHAIHHRQETAETKQATAMLPVIAAKGAEVEAQMVRIVKLYPGSEVHFKKYMALHD